MHRVNWLYRHAYTICKTTSIMYQITIKIPSPKFRLYWCFIEFIDWRDSQSYWYFRPSFVNFVFDQILNLQNSFTTPNRPPAVKSLYMTIFKKSRPLGLESILVIWSMTSKQHLPNLTDFLNSCTDRTRY